MIVWGGFDNNVFWLKTGGIPTRLRVEKGDPVGVIYDAPFKVQLSDTTVVQLWIVDPAVDEVKIYQSREDAQLPATTLGVGGTLSTQLLPGLSIDLARVFES